MKLNVLEDLSGKWLSIVSPKSSSEIEAPGRGVIFHPLAGSAEAEAQSQPELRSQQGWIGTGYHLPSGHPPARYFASLSLSFSKRKLGELQNLPRGAAVGMNWGLGHQHHRWYRTLESKSLLKPLSS
jgi:hypothetical protein